jgi:hypothetical protein
MTGSLRTIPKKQFRFAENLNAALGPTHRKANGSQACSLKNDQSRESVASCFDKYGAMDDWRIPYLLRSPLF